MQDHSINATAINTGYSLSPGYRYILTSTSSVINSVPQSAMMYADYNIPGGIIVVDGYITTTGRSIYASGRKFQVDVGTGGTVTGSISGIYFQLDYSMLVNNAGTLHGDLYGIDFINQSYSSSPAVPDRYLITNSGSLTSGADGAAIHYRTMNDGRNLLVEVENSGLISGYHSILLGNQPIGGDQATRLKLTNTGTMDGVISTATLIGDDVIRNDGTINPGAGGRIDLGGGNDRFINSGTIGGAIYLGDGDNVYRAFGSGTVQHVSGGSGTNRMYGADANDVFLGSAGDDTLMGFDGDDTFFASTGADLIVGGAGFDTLVLRLAAEGQVLNLLDGSLNVGLTAGDTIRGVEGIIGSDFDDHLVGSNVANRILGGGGDDLIEGMGGDDMLVGGAGNDSLDGGSGHDVLHGGDGDDYLFGGRGNDTLRGDDGNDTLDGGTTRDDDLLIGGDGADTFVLHRAGGNDIVHDLSAEDSVVLNGFAGMSAAEVIAQYGAIVPQGASLRFSAADSVIFRGADLDLLQDVLIIA